MLTIAVRSACDTDVDVVTRIYNQGIADRIATFETRLRTPDELLPVVTSSQFSCMVATVARDVVGFASTSAYRDRACYAGVAEFSIYIERSWRGQGIGVVLMDGLCQAAQTHGYWKVLSRVFVENTASRRMLARAGFREVGIYQRHAQLEGNWRDVVIVEKLLDDPSQ
jgi:phosphinothricin acetyltransferase